MIKNIVFISDFFAEQVTGGAEIYDNILINELKNQNIKVVKFNSNEFTKSYFDFYRKHDFHFLISNFVNLNKELIKYIQVFKNAYSILEHDHKYDTKRNPGVYNQDFIVPKSSIINKLFYENAKNVFCQSQMHEGIINKNLNLQNTINLSCSLWSEEQLNVIRKNLKNKKSNNLILKDSNPIKGTRQAELFCKEKGIEYVTLEKTNYEEYVEILSRAEKLIFFPQTPESFCRVVLEARMLNCSLATNKMNGCTHEPWFKGLKGEELIDYVSSLRNNVVQKIIDNLSKNNEYAKTDLTVILNCYRRPYNLEMQIKAIREQSFPPREIWLWVNDHEDNHGFNFDSLDVDKIFLNNHNWKFYGRFAAALLADTEFVAIYDDDTIPGSDWHKNCFETMEKQPGILGSAGVKLNSNLYADHIRCGWPSKNEETIEVDLVGHAWFFKREWLGYLWKEKPFTWDNGEDIQFSSMAKIHGGVRTFCPPHPPEEESLHGSILGNELGIDSKATSNNNEVTHQQFFSQRDECVQSAIKNGWKTVDSVK